MISTNCRVCNSKVAAFMSFGKMPIANGFLLPNEYPDEYYFELAPGFCHECKMVQLIEQPDPKKMFHENYAFFSQTSKGMIKHFKELADMMIDHYIPSKEGFIVELGSNDGIFLQNIQNKGIKHLGIEPSKNVAEVAIANNINTWNRFFSRDTALDIIKEYGHADVVTSANVMCHIPDILDIAKGIELLLKPTGVLIFEDPYIGDVIEKTSYDQFYDEHVFMFGVQSVSSAFAYVDMQIFDVEHLNTHGGSLRYYLCKKGQYSLTERYKKQLKYEENLQLDKISTYKAFEKNCERSKTKLVATLNELKDSHKHIVGYAATSKSTTVLNYCGIGPNVIDYICDTTPIKQGKYTPGMHIPVKAYEEFCNEYPDFALLLAWNHKNEIFAKENNFSKVGGKWITFVPEVEIISN